MKTEKRMAGRPTKFDENFHPQDLVKWMAQGRTNVRCCAEWGITEDTFYNWIKKHPVFSEHYKKGKSLLRAWWIEKGHQLLDTPTKECNPAIYIWMTKNIIKWSDRVAVSDEEDADSMEFSIE